MENRKTAPDSDLDTQKYVLSTRDGGIPVLVIEKGQDGKHYLTAGDGNFGGEMSPHKVKIWEERIYNPISLCVEDKITGDDCMEAIAEELGLHLSTLISMLSEKQAFVNGRIHLKKYIYKKTPIYVERTILNL